jgi:tRNA threonylcarbamoyladenosine biosynthesis protein TsaE
MRVEILTKSAEETRAAGRRLAAALKPGDVIELSGPLGAGKTELVRGLAEGLGGEVEVSSPTFTIVNAYPTGVPLYHIDLYRVHDQAELNGLGLEEYLYGDGVAAVEWLSLCPQIAPERRLLIALAFEGEEARRISLEALGGDPRLEALVRAIGGGR